MNLSADQLTDLGSLAKTYLPRIPIESFNSVTNTETKTENSTNTDSAQVKKDDFANNDTQQSTTAKKDIETSAPTNSVTNLTIDGEAQENSTTKNYDASLAVLGTLVTTTAKTLLPLPLAPVVDLVSTTANTAVDLVTKPTIVTDASGNKHKKASLWDQFTGGISTALGLNNPNSFVSKIWSSTKQWLEPLLKPFKPICDVVTKAFNAIFGSPQKQAEMRKIEEARIAEEERKKQELELYYEKQRLEKERTQEIYHKQELAKETQHKEAIKELMEEELKKKEAIAEATAKENKTKQRIQELRAAVDPSLINLQIDANDDYADVLRRALPLAAGQNLDLFAKIIEKVSGVDIESSVGKLVSAGCSEYVPELLKKISITAPSTLAIAAMTEEIIKREAIRSGHFNLLT